MAAQPPGQPGQRDAQPGDVEPGVTRVRGEPSFPAAAVTTESVLPVQDTLARSIRIRRDLAEGADIVAAGRRPRRHDAAILTDDRYMDEMASEDLAGRLLVATPMLGDPNFSAPSS